jgi:hypothetical protein
MTLLQSLKQFVDNTLLSDNIKTPLYNIYSYLSNNKKNSFFSKVFSPVVPMTC